MPPLPAVPEVSRLMGCVHRDLLSALDVCRRLTPLIQPEAVLEFKDPGNPGEPAFELSCATLSSSVARSVQVRGGAGG